MICLMHLLQCWCSFSIDLQHSYGFVNGSGETGTAGKSCKTIHRCVSDYLYIPIVKFSN